MRDDLAMTPPATSSSGTGCRFVRLRCSICNEPSPVCDQRADIRRDSLVEWWSKHLQHRHIPAPIIEPAPQEWIDAWNEGAI